MPTPVSMSTPAASESQVVVVSSRADCQLGSFAPLELTPHWVGSP
ncbi:MAG: hypothetical protein BWY94_02345 [Actinobacteria bacterium ADurb.BinA094]|nr:MAG: hypothetical protein BWY94_02345 [Actinobacteria bacterium ADurb.BinA094]